jgi:hypothetical protein
MRMRGTIAPKTPSNTMPSRTPMMIVFVMSRFLVEERRNPETMGPAALVLLRSIVARDIRSAASRDPLMRTTYDAR